MAYNPRATLRDRITFEAVVLYEHNTRPAQMVLDIYPEKDGRYRAKKEASVERFGLLHLVESLDTDHRHRLVQVILAHYGAEAFDKVLKR